MVVAKKTGGETWDPAPEGLNQVVCVDVIDKGEIEDTFNGVTKKVHKVVLRWQTEAVDPKRKCRYEVQQWYTLSLHEKARLCKDLQSWRGKPFSTKELEGFELDNLVGVNAQISVVHKAVEGRDKPYANLSAIMPIAKGTKKLEPLDYIREQDRPAAGEAAAADEAGAAVDEEEVPF